MESEFELSEADLFESADVLGSKYTLEILDALDEPLSAYEIRDNQDIPIATVYRRLEALQEEDYIREKCTDLNRVNGTETVKYERTGKLSKDLLEAAVYFSEFESRNDFVNEFLDGSDGI